MEVIKVISRSMLPFGHCTKDFGLDHIVGIGHLLKRFRQRKNPSIPAFGKFTGEADWRKSV